MEGVGWNIGEWRKRWEPEQGGGRAWRCAPRPRVYILRIIIGHCCCTRCQTFWYEGCRYTSCVEGESAWCLAGTRDEDSGAVSNFLVGRSGFGDEPLSVQSWAHYRMARTEDLVSNSKDHFEDLQY